jgi:ADP-ribose pyrophosphatase
MSWKKLSSKIVYKNKWMEVTEDKVKTNFNKLLTFGVVRKRPGVLIIPWDGHFFYLVGQYRYSVDKFSWEFPQGHYEHKSIRQTAQKELNEETGLLAKNIREIGKLYLAPGHHSQICHVFLATNLIEGRRELEESEQGMRRKKVTFKELRNMIIKGTVKDSPTIAALGMMIVKVAE